MTELEVVQLVGSFSGFVSIAGLLVTIGIYKGMVDRHERILNTMTAEALQQMFRKGKVTKGSGYILMDVAIIPECIRFKLNKAVAARHHAPTTLREQVHNISGYLLDGDLSQMAEELEIEVLQAMVLCATYIRQHIDGRVL